MMVFLILLLNNVFAINVVLPTVKPVSVERPPQFVHLAFDGSKSINMWKHTREFAQNHNAKFTYFISGVYFLTQKDKNLYTEPALGVGKSAIGWGGTTEELKERLLQVQMAVEEKNEMASHANAHFDGSKWSEQQWDLEHSQFTNVLELAWARYGLTEIMPTWWTDLFQNNMIGFRAPLLGVSSGLWPSLKKNNFKYDTSRVQRVSYWPKKINEIWDFPLAGLKIHGSSKNTLSMDYNFYVAQSAGKDGSEDKFTDYEEQMYQTYIDYFTNNYNGNRAPVHIGHHFSQWNGGAYWKAMKRFAETVCDLPEVKCSTYSELYDFMKDLTPEYIAELEKGNFPKSEGKLSIRSRGILDRKSMDLSNEELEELRRQSGDHYKAHEE